jgi:hypothetical protein
MQVPARSYPRRVGLAVACLLAAMVVPQLAKAGHESPFYPSFYPQEIRIETLDPPTAAASWPKARVHAYVGDNLFVGGPMPADATEVASLRSYLVLTFDAEQGRYGAGSSDRQSRCAAARQFLPLLARTARRYVFHPYPVTPYHADYLDQFDLARVAQTQYSASVRDAADGQNLRIRAKGPLAATLLASSWKSGAGEWDATLEEIPAGQLGEPATVSGGTAASPWIKQGWFQAYLLYAQHLRAPATKTWVEATYRRLVTGRYRNATERTNLQRALVSTLVAGCERVVVGYTLRREYFNADYSSGVENVAFDSQSGFLSSIFPRSVKLKDFPWNGWLRLGIAARPDAAWNPVGGLGDPFGRLLWLSVSDPALLSAPYGGSWIANRASISPTSASGAVAIPKDAFLPEAGTGLLRRLGAGKIAQQRLRYSVVTSAFHDGTLTGVADIIYPYIFAFRWGVPHPRNGATFDPAVARSTGPVREWLAGFKVIEVNTQTRDFGGDLKFSYRVPVVDVYLRHRSTDPWEAAAVAPPWSTLPWDVIVLMEEAVERGIAAFTEAEAQRRGIPWLDLVRDRMTGERLAALVDQFRSQAYRPASLRDLVTADEAQARWKALHDFYAQHGHFLVTNGPYRLDSWTGDGVALQVFRDSSYPLGVGAFDDYAIPLRAYASKIEDRGDRIEIRADVDRISKFQRSYEIERVALDRATEDADDHDRPQCHYMIVGPSGNVVRAGTGLFGKDGEFMLDLKDLRGPGMYTVLAALYIGGNSVNPEVKSIEHRVAGALEARHLPLRHSVAIVPR